MARVRLLVATAALLLATTAAAKRVQPPLTALRTPSANSISATVLAVQEDPPALSVKVEEVFFGRPRTEFKILVSPLVLPRVETGARYVFVYGDIEAVPGKPGVFRQAENGTLASFDGAEPAMFRDNSQIRALLDPAHSRTEDNPLYKTEVLNGLRSADPQINNLWAGELALRAEVLDAITPADVSQIIAYVDSVDSHPSGRTLLLRTAVEFAPRMGEGWFLDSAQQIVSKQPIENPTDLLNSAQLAAAAFEIVRGDPRPLPIAALTRWLRCSQPTLVEHALLKLRAQAPEAEAPAIEAALAEQLLPNVTRMFLLDHLRRLRLTDSSN